MVTQYQQTWDLTLILVVCLGHRYNTTIDFLDIIHRLIYYLKNWTTDNLKKSMTVLLYHRHKLLYIYLYLYLYLYKIQNE
jgi:hypothetical protein